MGVEVKVQHPETAEHGAVRDSAVVIIDDTDEHGTQQIAGSSCAAALVEGDNSGVETAQEGKESRVVTKVGTLISDGDKISRRSGSLGDAESREESDGESRVGSGTLNKEGLGEREGSTRGNTGLEISVPSRMLENGRVEPSSLALLNSHDGLKKMQMSVLDRKGGSQSTHTAAAWTLSGSVKAGRAPV